MSDEFVDLELALQVVVNEIWELGAAFDTAKSAAFPYTTGDQLECCEFLIRLFLLMNWRDTYDE